MSPLSPAAQAVLDAATETFDLTHDGMLTPAPARLIAAATVRALVDQALPREPVWGMVMSDGWILWRQRRRLRREILAIAAELDPSASLTGET